MNLNDVRNELEDISHSLGVTSGLIQDILNDCSTTDTQRVTQTISRVYIMTEYITVLSGKVSDIVVALESIETKGTDI